MPSRIPRLGSYRLQDHHITSSRGNVEALSEALCALTSDINMGAEFLAYHYRVDAAVLWPVDRLRVGVIDGVETIVLTTKQPNRHSDRSRPPTATPGVDLLDKFVHKARPAAAAMGYFLLAMERTAQRLSKRHQAFVRRSWKLRPAQMDNQSPPVGIDDDVLLRELARLNEFEVAIARLCIVEGRTQVEVASLLGLTRPRVQKAVKSILTKLRLAIRPYAR